MISILFSMMFDSIVIIFIDNTEVNPKAKINAIFSIKYIQRIIYNLFD